MASHLTTHIHIHLDEYFLCIRIVQILTVCSVILLLELTNDSLFLHVQTDLYNSYVTLVQLVACWLQCCTGSFRAPLEFWPLKCLEDFSGVFVGVKSVLSQLVPMPIFIPQHATVYSYIYLWSCNVSLKFQIGLVEFGIILVHKCTIIMCAFLQSDCCIYVLWSRTNQLNFIYILLPGICLSVRFEPNCMEG